MASMDAMSFELLRYSCQQYYDSVVNQIQKAKKETAKDSKGSIVQATYTISLKNSAAYTLNLYLTKCSLLTIGKTTQHCLMSSCQIFSRLCPRLLFKVWKVKDKQ